MRLKIELDVVLKYTYYRNTLIVVKNLQQVLYRTNLLIKSVTHLVLAFSNKSVIYDPFTYKGPPFLAWPKLESCTTKYFSPRVSLMLLFRVSKTNLSKLSWTAQKLVRGHMWSSNSSFPSPEKSYLHTGK